MILLVVRKAYLDPSFKLLLFYLFAKLVIDLIMLHSASLHRNNLIFYNLSIPLFYALLSGMFYYKINSQSYKRLLTFTMVGFAAFTIWDIFHSNSELNDMHNHRAVLYSMTVQGVLIIAIILLYFYEIIKSLQIPNLLTFPFFWVCSGLLLYFSSLIFIAPVLHYTATWNNSIDLGIIRTIPFIFEILCAVLFSVGIYYFPLKDYAKQ
ncbi:hypothetical protein [Dyadobacter luticola]|uniref:hypothetical protein n=1 Tax=Dyadobacter luticola TaxID=1979387 RepID=UPI001E46B665|nr:hypothetical protein [Dyadobacter luticola]